MDGAAGDLTEKVSENGKLKARPRWRPFAMRRMV